MMPHHQIAMLHQQLQSAQLVNGGGLNGGTPPDHMHMQQFLAVQGAAHAHASAHANASLAYYGGHPTGHHPTGHHPTGHHPAGHHSTGHPQLHHRGYATRDPPVRRTDLSHLGGHGGISRVAYPPSAPEDDPHTLAKAFYGGGVPPPMQSAKGSGGRRSALLARGVVPSPTGMTSGLPRTGDQHLGDDLGNAKEHAARTNPPYLAVGYPPQPEFNAGSKHDVENLNDLVRQQHERLVQLQQKHQDLQQRQQAEFHGLGPHQMVQPESRGEMLYYSVPAGTQIMEVQPGMTQMDGMQPMEGMSPMEGQPGMQLMKGVPPRTEGVPPMEMHPVRGVDYAGEQLPSDGIQNVVYGSEHSMKYQESIGGGSSQGGSSANCGSLQGTSTQCGSSATQCETNAASPRAPGIGSGIPVSPSKHRGFEMGYNLTTINEAETDDSEDDEDVLQEKALMQDETTPAHGPLGHKNSDANFNLPSPVATHDMDISEKGTPFKKIHLNSGEKSHDMFNTPLTFLTQDDRDFFQLDIEGGHEWNENGETKWMEEANICLPGDSSDTEDISKFSEDISNASDSKLRSKVGKLTSEVGILSSQLQQERHKLKECDAKLKESERRRLEDRQKKKQEKERRKEFEGEVAALKDEIVRLREALRVETSKIDHWKSDFGVPNEMQYESTYAINHHTNVNHIACQDSTSYNRTYGTTSHNGSYGGCVNDKKSTFMEEKESPGGVDHNWILPDQFPLEPCLDEIRAKISEVGGRILVADLRNTLVRNGYDLSGFATLSSFIRRYLSKEFITVRNDFGWFFAQSIDWESEKKMREWKVKNEENRKKKRQEQDRQEKDIARGKGFDLLQMDPDGIGKDMDPNGAVNKGVVNAVAAKDTANAVGALAKDTAAAKNGASNAQPKSKANVKTQAKSKAKSKVQPKSNNKECAFPPKSVSSVNHGTLHGSHSSKALPSLPNPADYLPGPGYLVPPHLVKLSEAEKQRRKDLETRASYTKDQQKRITEVIKRMMSDPEECRGGQGDAVLLVDIDRNVGTLVRGGVGPIREFINVFHSNDFECRKCSLIDSTGKEGRHGLRVFWKQGRKKKPAPPVFPQPASEKKKAFLGGAQKTDVKASDDAAKQDEKGDTKVENKDTTGEGTVENQDNMGDAKVENKNTTGEGAVENQDNMGDSKVENQDSTVEGNVENQDSVGGGKVENKNTTSDAKVENKNTTGEAKVENKNTTSEGKVENKNTKGEGKIENQDSMVEGKVENKNTKGEGKIENQDSMVEGKVENLDYTGDAKVENKNTTGEGKVENKNATGDAKVENKNTRNGAKVENNNTAGDAKIENKNATGEGKVENQDSMVEGKVENLDYTRDAKVENKNIRGGAKVENKHTAGDAKVDNKNTRGGAKVENKNTAGDAKIENKNATGEGKVENQDSMVEGKVENLDYTGDAKVENKKFTGEGKVENKNATGDAKVENQNTGGGAKVENKNTAGDAKVENKNTRGGAKVENKNTAGDAKVENQHYMGDVKVGSQNYRGDVNVENADYTGDVKAGNQDYTGEGKVENQDYTGEGKGGNQGEFEIVDGGKQEIVDGGKQEIVDGEFEIVDGEKEELQSTVKVKIVDEESGVAQQSALEIHSSVE